jgi:hypothetical protein
VYVALGALGGCAFFVASMPKVIVLEQVALVGLHLVAAQSTRAMRGTDRGSPAPRGLVLVDAAVANAALIV